MSWFMHSWHDWPWIDCKSLMVGHENKHWNKKGANLVLLRSSCPDLIHGLAGLVGLSPRSWARSLTRLGADPLCAFDNFRGHNLYDVFLVLPSRAFVLSGLWRKKKKKFDTKIVDTKKYKSIYLWVFVFYQFILYQIFFCDTVSQGSEEKKWKNSIRKLSIQNTNSIYWGVFVFLSIYFVPNIFLWHKQSLGAVKKKPEPN